MIGNIATTFEPSTYSIEKRNKNVDIITTKYVGYIFKQSRMFLWVIKHQNIKYFI